MSNDKHAAEPQPEVLIVCDGPAEKQKDGTKHRWELATVRRLDKGNHPAHIAFVALRADADLFAHAAETKAALSLTRQQAAEAMEKAEEEIASERAAREKAEERAGVEGKLRQDCALRLEMCAELHRKAEAERDALRAELEAACAIVTSLGKAQGEQRARADAAEKALTEESRRLTEALDRVVLLMRALLWTDEGHTPEAACVSCEGGRSRAELCAVHEALRTPFLEFTTKELALSVRVAELEGALRKVLERFPRHYPTCMVLRTETVCTCGIAEAHAALSRTPPQSLGALEAKVLREAAEHFERVPHHIPAGTEPHVSFGHSAADVLRALADSKGKGTP